MHVCLCVWFQDLQDNDSEYMPVMCVYACVCVFVCMCGVEICRTTTVSPRLLCVCMHVCVHAIDKGRQ